MKKHFSFLLAAALSFITIGTSCGGYSHAFLWDPVTGIEDLGTLGEDSLAMGVNDSGTVVGYYATASALTYRGFIWTASTGMVDFGLPAGEDGATTVSCRCTAINSVGHVVGYARQADGKQVAFFWTPETGFTTIGFHSNSGDNGNTAYAINDRDEVTGNLLVPHRATYHAYIWSPTHPRARDLGGIGDSPYGSTAAGINNLSEIAGDFGNAGGVGPMLWKRKTGVRLLGKIPDAIYTQTTGVNDAREIVGFYNAGTGTVSFYTAPGLGLQVLKNLGSAETYALAINQSGIVAGEAADASGIKYPVIWETPSALPQKIASSDGGAFGINSLGQVVGFTYFQ
jgi:probable HAF family extracellular repeat protein